MLKALIAKLYVFGLICALATGPAYADEVKALYQKLDKSVVALERYGDVFCTASKVGPGVYLTAAHCTRAMGQTKLSFGYTYLFPRFMTVGLRPFMEGDDEDTDWALITTTTISDERNSLEVECSYTPEVGDRIGYLGYPQGHRAFFVGRVSTMERLPNRAPDIWGSIDGAPGASGSPLVLVETGKVIGILTEGAFASHGGHYSVGFETIKNSPLCGEFRDNEGHPISTESKDRADDSYT